MMSRRDFLKRRQVQAATRGDAVMFTFFPKRGCHAGGTKLPSHVEASGFPTTSKA